MWFSTESGHWSGDEGGLAEQGSKSSVLLHPVSLLSTKRRSGSEAGNRCYRHAWNQRPYRVRHVASASVFRRQKSKEKCICPWMMALRWFGGILRRPVRIGFNWSDAQISQESINGRVRYTPCPVRRCSIPLLRLVILLSNSDKEGSVKKIRKSSFVSSFVGIFRSKCMNGLWVLVLGGERHAKH